MPTYNDIVTSGRAALGVRRYHTWPGIRRQGVDSHTAQMMRIYFSIWGPLSPRISTAILFHDAGEGQAGDGQFQAKRKYPALKTVLDKIEADTLQAICDQEVIPTYSTLPLTVLGGLEDWERDRIKAVDLIEGFEFALDELATGNMFALGAARAYDEAIQALMRQLGTEEGSGLVQRYLCRPNFRWLRDIYKRAETNE